MSLHNAETGTSLHVVHAFTYANSTARAAASVTSGDIGKVALQTDTSQYYILQNNSPVTWSQISGAGGGAGGINYIGLDSVYSPTQLDDRNAEGSIGNWVAYKDAAGASPVDMTGGSPTVAISRTTTAGEFLNGSTSFKVVKDAANRQGEGVSCVGYVPPAYRITNSVISIPFKIISGTLVQGDLKVFIYDVTNSVVITPFNSDVVGTQGTVTAICADISSTTAQIRVGFHFASTSATAVTFSFDDISVGPSTAALGGAMTDWVSFPMTIGGSTTAPTKGTTAVDQALWRRVGDSMEIKYDFRQTSTGSSGSGTYLFPLPSGYSIDSSKMTLSTTGFGTKAGEGSGANTTSTLTTNFDPYVVFPYNATNLAMLRMNGSTANQLGSATGSMALGGQADASFNFHATVPISGWSSNVTMAESSTFKISSYLANGSRVTGSSPTLLGQYRSYLRGASVKTYTETNGTPSTLPTVADGIAMNCTDYGSADPSGLPSKYEIFVGKNKNVKVDFYRFTGRTGTFMTDVTMDQSGVLDMGIYNGYDPTTGIVTVYKPTDGNLGYLGSYATPGTGSPGIIAGGTQVYFDITVSENALAVSIQSPRSEVNVSGGNGYGSVGTKIRRFTNINKNVGSAISYLDSSSAGSSFTINEPGVYSMTYLDGNNQRIHGFSVNASSLSTSINALSYANGYRYAQHATSGLTQGGSITLALNAGDVVRAHSLGDNDATTDNTCNFQITQVSK